MDQQEQQAIHPEQKNWFERGNFYNESEPFKRGTNEYVYRARMEEVEPGRYHVYMFEFRKDTWKKLKDVLLAVLSTYRLLKRFMKN